MFEKPRDSFLETVDQRHSAIRVREFRQRHSKRASNLVLVCTYKYFPEPIL
jgi:hypothetical protein